MTVVCRKNAGRNSFHALLHCCTAVFFLPHPHILRARGCWLRLGGRWGIEGVYEGSVMVVFSAFCRPVVALALLVSAFAVSASPASARSHHSAYRYVHARHAYRHVPRRFAQQPQFAQTQFFGQPDFSQAASYPQAMSYPQAAYRSRVARRHIERRVALARLRRYAETKASATPYEPGAGLATSGSSSGLVMEARQFLGTKPSGIGGSLWCARFMNMVLEKTGYR